MVEPLVNTDEHEYECRTTFTFILWTNISCLRNDSNLLSNFFFLDLLPSSHGKYHFFYT